MINNELKRILKLFVPPEVLWLPRYYMLFKWVRFRNKELVLDAACGEGHVTRSLNKKGITAIGIDRSQTNIHYAAESDKSKFIIGDIRQLPFKKDTFNTIVSLDTLEHIAQDAVVFKEFHRVLKPGGRLVATVPSSQGSIYQEQVILRRVIPCSLYSRNLYNNKPWLRAKEEDILAAQGHLHTYSIIDLEQKILSLFKIVRYEYFLKKFSALATDVTYGIKGLWNLRFMFFLIAVRLDYFFQKNKKGYWLIAEFSKLYK